MLKMPFLLVLLFVFISSAFAASEHNKLLEVTSFPIDLQQGKTSIGKIVSSNGKAVMHYTDGKKQHLLDLPSSDTMQLSDNVALVGDFNFDGLTDIALFVSSGYGGVNQFYDLFVMDKKEGQLSSLMSIANPSLKPAKQQLSTAQRSGPRWYETVYQFAEGQVVQYADYSMITETLFYREIYKNEKRVSASVVTNTDADSNDPVFRKITLDKAILYDKPDDNTATRMYVIKGDDVELLDYQQDQLYEDWLFIRFKGRRVIEKWIKSDAIYTE